MNLLAFWAPHPGTVLFILNLILQVTLATSVGWLLVALLRRRSALLRYEVQLSVLLFVFFAPLTTWAAEKLLTPQAGLPRTTVQPQALMITDIPSLDAQPGAMNWKGIVLLCVLSLWVAGSIFFFTRFIRGFNTIRQIRRPSRPVRIPRIKEAVEHATEQLGLRKPPKVYTSPRVHAPITLGFFRPMLILPESMAQDQNDKALQGIILHEVAHIARRDLWVGLVHSVVGILYWWHPLVRRLERDLIGLREEICDSYVCKATRRGCTPHP